MFNSLRLTHYLDKYFDLFNNFYRNELRVILTTYYLFDHITSIYDKDILQYGAYERIGNLSGYKWIKILYFPVGFSTETHPVTQPTQYGIIKKTETYCVFPKVNFEPTMLDFVIFTLRNVQLKHLYQITSIEEAFLDKSKTVPIYKVTLKEQPYTLDKLNNQVSSTYAYSEISDKIYTVEGYNNIVQTSLFLKDLENAINNTREKSSGLIPTLEI